MRFSSSYEALSFLNGRLISSVKIASFVLRVNRQRGLLPSGEWSPMRGDQARENYAAREHNPVQIPLDSSDFGASLTRKNSERYVKCRCYGLGGIGIPRAAQRAI
jgi:hypothetical protein